MKTLPALLFALALTGALVAQGSPTSATPPQEVTITLSIAPGIQTWTATGAVTDFGSWTVDSVQLTGSIFHSPVVGAFKESVTLTGSNSSTITIDVNGLFVLNDAGVCCDTQGRWRVASGTGSYANLHGEGGLTRTFPATVVVLQGVVSVDGV